MLTPRTSYLTWWVYKAKLMAVSTKEKKGLNYNMRKPYKAVVPPVIASWRKRSGLELIIKELSSTRQTSTSESHTTTRAKWKDFDLKRKRRLAQETQQDSI